MAYKIVYKKRYLNNIAKLVAYLRLEWNETIATEVVYTINNKISQVSRNHYLGSLQGSSKSPEYYCYKASPALLPYPE